MLKRHARAACTALAAAGLLLAGTGGAIADSAPATPSAATTLRTADAPPELLAAMGRDLGLTPTQAEARLAHEAEAGATAARLRDRLGAAFAGAWVDGADAGTLTVATTRAADTAAIRAAGARAKLVTRTLAALDADRAVLDRAAGPRHRSATSTRAPTPSSSRRPRRGRPPRCSPPPGPTPAGSRWSVPPRPRARCTTCAVGTRTT